MRGKQKIAHYLDIGQKISDSMSPIETKEDAKEINPPTERPTGQSDFCSSRKRGEQKTHARNSVSSGKSAPERSLQTIAEALPLDQPGWSADYSLPTGNDRRRMTENIPVKSLEISNPCAPY
jgi:hypothetical protein